ncbi:MAG: GntR family transcriptional regulator, partial [Clostridium sp.]
MDTLIPNKSKELLYVTVYDKLFKMITEGTFPKNSRLPSEPDLAKRLGVSRST